MELCGRKPYNWARGEKLLLVPLTSGVMSDGAPKALLQGLRSMDLHPFFLKAGVFRSRIRDFCDRYKTWGNGWFGMIEPS